MIIIPFFLQILLRKLLHEIICNPDGALFVIAAADSESASAGRMDIDLVLSSLKVSFE